ncbi:hypothetical protein PAPHI01_1908 [Pancytospora philotis]|nr:hypothetical protein PAPHI01_1908 [Pancytospora philotis]
MAHEGSKKRKAEEQLSPYSKDPEDHVPAAPAESPADTSGARRPRARRNKGSGSTAPQGDFKGIFGKVSLASPDEQEAKGAAGRSEKAHERPQPSDNDLVAGLNRSFLKALELVVSKQANRDLTYLFKQYGKYVAAIKKSEKSTSA